MGEKNVYVSTDLVSTLFVKVEVTIPMSDGIADKESSKYREHEKDFIFGMGIIIRFFFLSFF